MKDTCEFIRENGERCRSWTMNGSRFCFNHSKDPKVMTIKAAAIRKGGMSRGRPDGISDWADMSLGTPIEVSKLLECVINRVIKGEISTQRASAVSSLCSTMNKSLEQGPMEERIKAIEARLAEMGPSR